MQINIWERRGWAVKRRGLPGESRRELGRLVQMMSVMRFHSSHRLWLILRLNPALCAHWEYARNTHTVWGSGSHRGNERQEEAQIGVDGEIPQVTSHSHTHTSTQTRTHKQLIALHKEIRWWEMMGKSFQCLLSASWSTFWAWDSRSSHGGPPPFRDAERFKDKMHQKNKQDDLYCVYSLCPQRREEMYNPIKHHALSVEEVPWPQRLSSYWQWFRSSLIIQPGSHLDKQHSSVLCAYSCLKAGIKLSAWFYSESLVLCPHQWGLTDERQASGVITSEHWSKCHSVCHRASDDPEKTNTTYVEESQPTHGKRNRTKTKKCREELMERWVSERGSTDGDRQGWMEGLDLWKRGIFLTRQHKRVMSVPLKYCDRNPISLSNSAIPGTHLVIFGPMDALCLQWKRFIKRQHHFGTKMLG